MKAFITAKSATDAGVTVAVEFREDDGTTVVKSDTLAFEPTTSVALVRSTIQQRLSAMSVNRARSQAVANALQIGEL